MPINNEAHTNNYAKNKKRSRKRIRGKPHVGLMKRGNLTNKSAGKRNHTNISLPFRQSYDFTIPLLYSSAGYCLKPQNDIHT